MAAKYLVDANVLSETMRQSPNPTVVAWLEAHEPQLVVDPIVLGEIYTGILKLPRGKKRSQLEHWFTAVVERVVCLAWDSVVGLRWAKLLAELQQSGQAMPLLDSMIAATALSHGLTVATRNTTDFQKAGARVLNPFEGF